ncbi:hypothetical protein CR513_21457, partial [Mucuna pruriens]
MVLNVLNAFVTFQCSNKRAMILMENGEIESDSSHGDTSTSSDLESQVMIPMLKGIFLWCHVKGNLCFVIIDGGSCVNVASERLQWLSECGALVVDRQVEVSFTIGKYEDKVLCNLVPMEATHLLLGRPWQYDRKVIHDGVTNRLTFVHMGRKVVLKPLSLKAIQED